MKYSRFFVARSNGGKFIIKNEIEMLPGFGFGGGLLDDGQLPPMLIIVPSINVARKGLENSIFSI